MDNKDWTGNYNSVWKTLGASNHCPEEREQNDYYATHPKAAELLLEIEDLDKNVPIWECSSGENHLADVFKEHGYKVRTSDIVKRTETTEQLDFLSEGVTEWNGNIVTNPPYKYAAEFVKKALDIIPRGAKCIMFLKQQFMEGKQRRKLFEKYPPKTVWVSSGRLACAKNGEFGRYSTSAVAYAWFVWEKGYSGETKLKWFN